MTPFIQTLFDSLEPKTHHCSKIILHMDLLTLYHTYPYELNRYILDGEWRILVEQRIKKMVVEKTLHRNNSRLKVCIKDDSLTNSCINNVLIKNDLLRKDPSKNGLLKNDHTENELSSALINTRSPTHPLKIDNIFSHPALIQISYNFINIPPIKICLSDLGKIQMMQHIEMKKNIGNTDNVRNNGSNERVENVKNTVNKQNIENNKKIRNNIESNMINKHSNIVKNNTFIADLSPLIDDSSEGISHTVKGSKHLATTKIRTNIDRCISNEGYRTNTVSSMKESTVINRTPFTYTPSPSALVTLTLHLFFKNTEYRLFQQVFECTEGLCRDKSLWVVQYVDWNNISNPVMKGNGFNKDGSRSASNTSRTNSSRRLERGNSLNNANVKPQKMERGNNSRKTERVYNTESIYDIEDTDAHISGKFPKLFHFSNTHCFILPTTAIPLYCRGCQSPVQERVIDRIVEKCEKMSGWWENQQLMVINRVWCMGEGAEKHHVYSASSHRVLSCGDTVLGSNACTLSSSNIVKSSENHRSYSSTIDSFGSNIKLLGSEREIHTLSTQSTLFDVFGYFIRDNEHNEVFMAMRIRNKKNFNGIGSETNKLEELNHINKKGNGMLLNILSHDLYPLNVTELLLQALLSILSMFISVDGTILIFTDESHLIYELSGQIKSTLGMDKIRILKDFDQKCVNTTNDKCILLIQDEQLACNNTVEEFDWIFLINITKKNHDRWSKQDRKGRRDKNKTKYALEINSEHLSYAKHLINPKYILYLSNKLGINSSKLIYTLEILINGGADKFMDVYGFLEKFMVY